MTKTKSTKRALLVSLLALLTCVSMLVGSTFAWFTDSVTSGNNIIKSGTLDVEMYWADGTEDPAAVTWADASAGAIFNYDLWEPGYTEVCHIKIANEGTLALKYQLNVVANGTVSDLSDVIDVYYIDPAAEVANRTDLKAEDKIGTLTEVLAAVPTTATGNLVAGENHTITLALVMQESAGNEYQNKSIGSTFSVQLLATQLTHEEDSFDNQYDVDSAFIVEAKNAEDLAVALAAGGAVKLANDITTGTSLVIPAGVAVNLDLNGKTLTGTMHKNDGAVINNKGTLTVVGGTIASTADNGGSAIVNSGTLTVENATMNGAPNANGSWPSYTFNNTGVATLNNTKITSYHGAVSSYNGGALVTLNNSEIDMAGIPGFTNHGIYTYSGGAVVVNGGTYANKATDQASTGGSVINGAVTVNAGNFSGRIENYYGTPVIKGGTFSVAPRAAFIAAGHTTVDNGNGTVSVVKGTAAANQSAMEAAFNSGEKTVVLSAGTYEFPNLVEGATIIGQDGVVFEDTLTGTLNNVTIKNVHIKESNAQRWAYSSGTLLFEDCTFEATGVYAIHYDGLNGANITYKNCTIIGWAAIGAGAEYVTFDGCTIKGNGTYGVLRLYSPATIKNCTFDVANVNTSDVYQDGIHAVDCVIKVANNTNVNGTMEAIYNVSGTGAITE